LIGVGRVTELLQQLDRAKTAWSRATNQMSQGLTELQSRQHSLSNAIETSARAATATSEVTPVWNEWWLQIEQFGIDRPGSIESAESASGLDQAVKRLV